MTGGMGGTELGHLLFWLRLPGSCERRPSSPVGKGRRGLRISPREVWNFRGLGRLSFWRPRFWIPPLTRSWFFQSAFRFHFTPTLLLVQSSKSLTPS